MQFTETCVSGAYVIDVKRIGDDRGFFARQWCRDTLAAKGLSADISQINTALNPRVGTLRGVHLQRPPHAEVKLAHCPRGAVFDVVLDLRVDSPSYLKWHGELLTGENFRALYLPEGCAHGYLTMEDDSVLTYFTSKPYAPGHATGVRFDDPAFGIEWPGAVRLVSEADRNWPAYRPGD